MEGVAEGRVASWLPVTKTVISSLAEQPAASVTLSEKMREIFRLIVWGLSVPAPADIYAFGFQAYKKAPTLPLAVPKIEVLVPKGMVRSKPAFTSGYARTVTERVTDAPWQSVGDGPVGVSE